MQFHIRDRVHRDIRDSIYGLRSERKVALIPLVFTAETRPVHNNTLQCFADEIGMAYSRWLWIYIEGRLLIEHGILSWELGLFRFFAYSSHAYNLINVNKLKLKLSPSFMKRYKNVYHVKMKIIMPCRLLYIRETIISICSPLSVINLHTFIINLSSYLQILIYPFCSNYKEKYMDDKNCLWR